MLVVESFSAPRFSLASLSVAEEGAEWDAVVDAGSGFDSVPSAGWDELGEALASLS